MPAVAVEVQNLSIIYPNGAHRNTAVDDVSFAVAAGQVTSILGPNGAGKTSTVEVCEGFRRPSSGQVRVLGLDPISDARELRPRIGVMLQEGGAWLGVRAGEMLRYVASLHAHPLDADELLERLGLEAHQSTQFRRLSGGQRQRLGLAMAIVGRPELVFLDEPTAGLDPQARHATWELISELRASGVTIVLTTHHMDEAQSLSDHIHILDHGALIASGTPDQLISEGSGDRIVVETRTGIDFSPLGVSNPRLATVTEIGPGRHRFDAHGSTALIAEIATWCANNDVEVRSIRLETPSLEDRFLDLTGRSLR